MSKRYVASTIALIALLGFSPLLGAQTAPTKGTGEKALPPWSDDTPSSKSAYAGITKHPAPRRDLSGIWDGNISGGIQAKGAIEHQALMPGHPTDDLGGQPDERNIFHPLPYTAAGLAALQTHRPAVGVRAVGPGLQNNPEDICDPVGFPQMDLFEVRVIELAQTKNQVLFLDEFNDNWRIIWTDGRKLPDSNDVEPRWNGYSVGKWVDDYTFVVDTVGMDERTWLDNAGRPHSLDMKVEERFHRVDYETLELTVTIDDPKYYTQPWKGMDKFVFYRLPDSFDMTEWICAPSEVADYNKHVGDPIK